MSHYRLEDFFEPARLVEAHARLVGATGLTVVYGTGAALVAPDADVLVSADLTRREIQLRQRVGAPNVGWGFDGVPEEIGLLPVFAGAAAGDVAADGDGAAAHDDVAAEIPAIKLVHEEPDALLGTGARPLWRGVPHPLRLPRHHGWRQPQPAGASHDRLRARPLWHGLRAGPMCAAWRRGDGHGVLSRLRHPLRRSGERPTKRVQGVRGLVRARLRVRLRGGARMAGLRTSRYLARAAGSAGSPTRATSAARLSSATPMPTRSLASRRAFPSTSSTRATDPGSTSLPAPSSPPSSGPIGRWSRVWPEVRLGTEPVLASSG